MFNREIAARDYVNEKKIAIWGWVRI